MGEDELPSIEEGQFFSPNRSPNAFSLAPIPFAVSAPASVDLSWAPEVSLLSLVFPLDHIQCRFVVHLLFLHRGAS